MRDSNERDLAVHVETALRGVMIADRWPKSGVDVVITILEGEDDHGSSGWGMMTVLAGCITAASAAIADAGIDCVDLVAGGVAALLPSKHGDADVQGDATTPHIVLDPTPRQHQDIRAACVLAYLASRDEITEIWVRGDVPVLDEGLDGASSSDVLLEKLTDHAVHAAKAATLVLAEAVKEASLQKLETHRKPTASTDGASDAVMAE